MVDIHKKAPTWASGLEGWPRSRLEQGGEFGLEGGLRHHADDLLDDFAAFEEEHGWDGADAILGGDCIVIVDVDLGNFHLAVHLGRNLL